MARRQFRARKIFVYGVYTIIATTFAAPEVAFPFNSQVPTVARVGQQYTFRFSPSTFAPAATNFTYSLSNQPSWLSVDSTTRTLSGTPSQSDVGAAKFTLTAADIDGVAHMACTLIVSKDPAPRMEGDINAQLSATANLSSSEPLVVTVLAYSAFHFQFKQGSFIDIVQRKLYYYSTLADHTPLPSWLRFDPQNLTFSGFAPHFAALPQSWNIEMIASDVIGFAAASAPFTITIVTQQLAFVPNRRIVHITAGESVKYEGLQNSLFRDGAMLTLGDLKSANALGPPWLSLDPSTLEIMGTAPLDVKDQNMTVTVYDKLGNQAAVLIYFVSSDSAIFAGAVGTLTARAGQEFNYEFPESLFTTSGVEIQVALPATAKWLHFDAASRSLSGKVPTHIRPSSIAGKIMAKSEVMPQAQTQAFIIKIISSNTESDGSHTSTASNSASTPSTARGGDKSRSHLNSGIVAAVVLGCLLAAAILVACLVFLRRWKRERSYVEQSSPNKRTISRPVIPVDPDAITVTTELQRDIEKTADRGFVGRAQPEAEHAPQIALDLPTTTPGRKLKWTKHLSRISQTSSLGNGETVIRADGNVPEFGCQSIALQNPHESFSVPAEIARSSKQLVELSPRKRGMKRLRRRRQASVRSVGLGIDTRGATVLPRRSSQGESSHKCVASTVGLSATMDESSVASFSTRGTSVLSARATEFPRPPTRSTMRGSRSIPGALLPAVGKHRSIRVVERDDSIADDRSMQEKRQSFVRNRASASFASPLFANGARVSSAANHNDRLSANGRSPMGRERSQRGTSQLTTYSESSSLEPPPRDPRRLSSRVRSAFAPNFPRAITNSTLGADNAAATNGDTSSFYTTSSSISEKDYTAEMALPRHERSWVLPGEASPTPPPAPPTSRQGSSTRRTTPPSQAGEPRQKWKERLREHSSSPLSTAVAVSLPDRNSLSASASRSQARRSWLSEPMSLVSNDSLSRTKPERPRLVQTSSRRPVSVEQVQRLSSFKADADDARPGSEMFEALEGAGLMPPRRLGGREGTQNSNLSGPAFL